LSLIQHGVRIGLLMAGVAGLFVWSSHHFEVSFADGLRYIRQAEQIDQGKLTDGLLRSVDHPIHPLAIVVAHRVIRGDGPIAWQRAAAAAAIAAGVLLIIPLYLVALEIYGPPTAWIGCLLIAASPLVGFLVINILSESTFLVFWTWGLWAAIRFLREGRFRWLPVTIGFSGLAYLTRPEGLLLPLALVATLILLPLHRATRINWPRWWAAIGFLVLGPLCLVGPYMAIKGGIGTKPSIARLIGTAPKSAPNALERDRPLPPEQTTIETYLQATRRMLKAFRGAIRTPLLPLVILGLVVARPWTARARIWLFTGIIVIASALALVRLHATGGYCTARHALVPGMLLSLAAAHGLAWLMRSVVIDGRWFGRAEERFRPGPAVWAALLAVLVASPYSRAMTASKGSFDIYREAGSWIAQKKAVEHGKVLDLTDWTLFFSQTGRDQSFEFANVHWGVLDPTTRWVVVRDAHIEGHWHYSRLLQDFLGGREPVAMIPLDPRPGQLQICIYDLRVPPTHDQVAAVARRNRRGRGVRK
jgi:Dolichyl-phosphate-mannose-protein mannosyltransferase